MKATPGPWKANPIAIEFDKNSNKPIGSFEVLLPVESMSFPEMHANANLIAAAPDMYEALKKAEFAIMQVPAMSEGVASLLEKAAASIENALAKAEGGTQ